jgi:hypothetical protein
VLQHAPPQPEPLLLQLLAVRRHVAKPTETHDVISLPVCWAASC